MLTMHGELIFARLKLIWLRKNYLFIIATTGKYWFISKDKAKHINYVASPKIFENFRDGKWREKMETVWILDGIEWEMRFISNDGRPILEIKSDMKPFLPPPGLVTLVNYVLKIGLPKDYKSNLFTEGELL